MNTLRLFHPHFRASTNRTEMWLKQKAYEGWQLIEFHGWTFIFRKCSPSEREYLIYSGFGTETGVSVDYHITKTKYGISKARSALNKQYASVFEADITKLDSEYFRFKKIRNQHYLKHYIGLFIISLLALICTIFLNFNVFTAFLALFWAVSAIYALTSSIILKHDTRKLKIET